VVDVAGDQVDVAPDGHDLEGRAGATAPGRDDLDRLSVAGPLAQEHLVAGEEVTATPRSWPDRASLAPAAWAPAVAAAGPGAVASSAARASRMVS
jgi:hypothetical protein